MKIVILLVIMCLPLLSMDQERKDNSRKFQKTEQVVIFDLKPKCEENYLATLIMEGSLDDFKANVQLDKLEYHTLELLKAHIHARKRALDIVSETRGIVGDHVDHIKEAIKKMPQQEQKRGKSFMPNLDKYVRVENTKLDEIQKLVDAEFNQYTQQWFTNDQRIGYTLTKKSKNESNS